VADVLGDGRHESSPACTRHPERVAVVALVLDHLDRRGPVTTRFLCRECHLALLGWWYESDLGTL